MSWLKVRDELILGDDLVEAGVITFHRAINYGAILQTYALQESIKELGSNPYVIDYDCKYLKKEYYPYNIVKCRTLKSIFGYIYKSPFEIVKRYKFTNFLKKNCKLKSTGGSDDIYITGSDQVWNHTLSNFDKAYFLDFVNNKYARNAYSASFGIDSIPNEYYQEYKGLLNRFNNISVREHQGAKLIEELIGRRVKVTLDPIFLLDKARWSKVARLPKEKDYIFLFLVSKSNSIIKFAEDLSRAHNLKIIFANDGMRKCKNATYLRTLGPDEWLGYLLNSKYIVTNSFHATAFSINFNKQFFTEPLLPPSNINSRLQNILELFDLGSRKILNGYNKAIDKEINYNKINELLGMERQKSIEYLNDIFLRVS